MPARVLTGAALLTVAGVIAKRTLEERPIRRPRGAAWPAPAARHAAAVAAAALPVLREADADSAGLLRSRHGHLAAWRAVRLGEAPPAA